MHFIISDTPSVNTTCKCCVEEPLAALLKPFRSRDEDLFFAECAHSYFCGNKSLYLVEATLFIPLGICLLLLPNHSMVP